MTFTVILLPGVDDGASDYEDTKKLLRMEYDQGVRNIIATPHFRFRMFETPLSRVQEQFLLVQKAAAEIGDDLQVYLGCEFHANMEMYRMLREGEVRHHGRFQDMCWRSFRRVQRALT